MQDKKYTIQELSELTGFSIRTIRYYVQEGLIDPPAGRGRGGFYFDSQLNQLKQIKSLQEKGMKLSSIVQYLKGDVAEEPSFARDVWVKYEIAPGLEISVRRDVEEKEGKKVLEIIKTVKSIVREEPDEER
jgi:DNA-binding transcriptional MerR regulator